MAKSVYTPEQREHALAVYREHGPAEAERQTSVPRKTIASWARRSQTQMDASIPERLKIATQVAKLNAQEKRAKIAELMWDKLAESLDRLGDDSSANGQESRLISTLVDKAQLLSGGPTARTEHEVTDPASRLAIVRDLKDAAGSRQEQTG